MTSELRLSENIEPDTGKGRAKARRVTLAQDSTCMGQVKSQQEEEEQRRRRKIIGGEREASELRGRG